MISASLYHRFLRIAVLATTLVLIFDSGLVIKDTARLADMATSHVATVVGVAASVQPNEVNQLTSRITELETELEAKERLIAVGVEDRSTSETNTSTIILSFMVFVLLCLIILNYVLDYLRRPIIINQKVLS